MAILVGETEQKLAHQPFDYKPDTQALGEFTRSYAALYDDCGGERIFSASTPGGVRENAQDYANYHREEHLAGHIHGIGKPDVPTDPCQPALTDVFEVWTTTNPTHPTEWMPIRES